MGSTEYFQNLNEKKFRSQEERHRLERRLEAAMSMQWTPNAEDAESGLTDPSIKVRSAMHSRKDIHLSTEQVERGLCDPAWKVRLSVVKRNDFTPSAEQVARGLAEDSTNRQQESPFFRTGR